MAEGRVLEIGAGSGLNFNFYDPGKVRYILALDPSRVMWSMAQKQLENVSLNVEFVEGVAENIPIEDNAVDTIVSTYTMCSLRDLAASFSEFRRVLKPTGKLVFCEHGRAPDTSVYKWQNAIGPVWKRLGGGCHLNRDIPGIIKTGAFKIDHLDEMYLPGFKPASYNYWGIAHPAN